MTTTTTTTTTIINYNESLFWKVIHNIYLFKIIIKSIDNQKYDFVNQIKLNNKIKFKDIKSLSWMINNNQFSLIKCKIEAGEDIVIEDDSLYTIYNAIKNVVIGVSGDDDENNQNNDRIYKKQLLKQLQESQDEKQIKFKEIFKLLLNHNYLEKYNLITFATHRILKKNNEFHYYFKINNQDINFEMIKILSPFIINNNNNSMMMISSLLELLVIGSESTQYLDEIIKMIDIIPIEFKNQSISLSFKNEKCTEIMIKYILSNSKLYSLPQIPTSKINIKLIKPNKLFLLKSIQLQSQLIELGYLKVLPYFENQFLEILKNNKECNFKNITKEIHKLLSINDNLIYFNYLLIYNDEIISEKKIINQTFFDKEFQLFKSLNIGIGTGIVTKPKSYIGKELLYLDSEKSIEIAKNFILYYLSNNLLHTKNDEIIKYTLKLKNRIDYESIYNLISESNHFYLFQNKLPTTWNEFLICGNNLVKSKSTIDWIIENKTWYSEYSRSYTYWINFETCELAYYAYEKFKPFKELSISNIFEQQRFFEGPFLKSIENCNIKELKNVNRLFKSTFQYPYRIHQLELKFSNHIEKQDVIKLIGYLSSSGYINFSDIVFNQFYKLIEPFNLSIDELKEIGWEYYPISLVYDIFIQHLFARYCSKFEFDVPFQVIFNNENFNLLKHNDNFRFDRFLNDGNYRSLEMFDMTSFYEPIKKIKFIKPKQSINSLVSCIEIMLNHYKLIENHDYSNYPFYQEKIQSYILYLERVLNRLFNEFLRHGSQISIIHLKEIYRLIFNNSNFRRPIKFKSNSYNLLYGILIKSNLFEKFILQLNFVLDPTTSYFRDDYYHFINLLDQNEYSFNYLFGDIKDDNSTGVSFDELLEKLINNLSHCSLINYVIENKSNEISESSLKHQNFINDSFNFNLNYLLKINNLNLFFKELEYIKQFSNTLINHESIINSDTTTNFDNIFTFNNFKFSKKLIENATKILNIESFQKFISYNPTQF